MCGIVFILYRHIVNVYIDLIHRSSDCLLDSKRYIVDNTVYRSVDICAMAHLYMKIYNESSVLSDTDRYTRRPRGTVPSWAPASTRCPARTLICSRP